MHLDSRDLIQVDLSSEPGAGSEFSDMDVGAGAEVESGPPSPSRNHRTSYFDNDRNDDDSDYEPPQVSSQTEHCGVFNAIDNARNIKP